MLVGGQLTPNPGSNSMQRLSIFGVKPCIVFGIKPCIVHDCYGDSTSILPFHQLTPATLWREAVSTSSRDLA